MFGLFGKKKEVPQKETDTKSYTFHGTGITHNCAFPSPRFKGRSRQFVLDKCRVGDAIYLKHYEWKGTTAYAIMSKKYETDIGVVPAEKVRAIHNKAKGSDSITGWITAIRPLDPDEEDYRKIVNIFDVSVNL